MDDWGPLLERTARHARVWLEGIDERRVFPAESPEDLRRRFDPQLPAEGEDPVTVIEDGRPRPTWTAASRPSSVVRRPTGADVWADGA